MIELQMVRRMALKAALLAPAVVAALWVAGGQKWGLSAAIGMAMAVMNLYLSGRIIGGVAERTPRLLMPVAMATFVLGLMLLTLIAVALRATDVVFFPVTGFTLIGCHLLVVLWEAAGAYRNVPGSASQASPPIPRRT